MDELQKLRDDLQERKSQIPAILLKPTFTEIDKLVGPTQVLFNIPKHNISCNAQLEKYDSAGFKMIVDDFVSDERETHDVVLIINGQYFHAKNLYILMRSAKADRRDGDQYMTGTMSSAANIRELSTKDFENGSSYFRFVIPAPASELDFYVYSSSYQTETTMWARGLIKLMINNIGINVYETKHNELKYLLVDSTERIDFKVFAEICHSIMIGYGFISGNFFQNEGYYIKSSNSEFSTVEGLSYLQFRKSIITHGTANPIYLNAYGYTKDQATIDKVEMFLKIFEPTLFSKLCAKIQNESEYAVLLLLIIESNQASLILKPAGYSVALEKITNIIAEENGGLKPIPDKKLSRELIKKMHALLQEYKSKIEEVGNEHSMIILTKNIDRLNSPTNQDKLTQPFKIYGITLSPEDIAAIKTRNSFLHATPLQLEEGSDEFLEIYMTALRLNKLVNKLILKHLGFSGHIINHLKHNEAAFPIKIDEDLFEPI